MPTISLFYGVVIRMYNREHGPPHFHAYYAEHDAAIVIETLEVLEGSLPRRALSLVLEWASQHRAELAEDWRLAMAQQPTRRIAPLR